MWTRRMSIDELLARAAEEMGFVSSGMPLPMQKIA